MEDYKTTLWSPSKEFIKQSNLKQYEEWLNSRQGLTFKGYNEIWSWSVENVPDFWESLWKYFDVKYSGEYEKVLSTENFLGASWFEGTELNYAEHIFRNSTTNYPAFIFTSERAEVISVSWNELHIKVAKLRTYLKNAGVSKGDCVAAFLPNIPETIISFLAVNSLGAIWSCCSPDFGVNTVVNRFSQIEPRILIAANGYQYKGKTLNRTKEAADIARLIPSIQKVIMIPYMDDMDNYEDEEVFTPWFEVLSTSAGPLEFERVPFSHPIWVLYSSGTTGKPKAITHSHGGMLLEHLKSLSLQRDVHRGEHFFWYTTTGWMMWNILQASMLVGGVPVLYDGSATFPDNNILWKLIEELPIHHFGTSAAYLMNCMKKGLRPGQSYDLSSLRSIGSTASPLPPEAFDWVYTEVSEDVWLCPASGGTDVCTAFVGGSPYLPVHRGTIQCRTLGCDLKAYNETGEAILGQPGEMVITKPMPSMPVFFWGDEDQKQYISSYYDKYPGKWCHGDLIQIFYNGSIIIKGRSDATLNRNGIRIGTAEIYSVLDQIPEIRDALAVNLEQPDGSDLIPLFVVLDRCDNLESVKQTIIQRLEKDCSPRHVPDKIIAVPDIPYTLSGKKMEIPIKKVLMGMDITQSMNKDAARNPEAVDHFANLAGSL